jgi:hypothetical protein
MAACSALSGLDGYSSKDCGKGGCSDATTHVGAGDARAPGEDATSGDDGGDATTADAIPGDETTDDTSPGDDSAIDSAPEDSGTPDVIVEGARDTGAGDASDAGPPLSDASIPCPDGGCPTSTAVQFSACPFGSCNGSTTSACLSGGGCFCVKDSQCPSTKCVKVTGENDQSCGSNCTGTGSRDGFDCELASPGIPAPTGSTATYTCPASSGYRSSTLGCDTSHTNCYCSADSQCPSGKCVPNATNNASCASPAGPCTGTGTPDFRGCQPTTSIPNCPIYIGCPSNTTCSYPVCYCTSDAVCESGHCIPSSHNGNCSGCTGTGTDDGHGCQPPPSSVACQSSGSGSTCTTSLSPAPVLNGAHTACLCVADTDCASGKCVNSNSQCGSGACTGSGAADSEDCETASSKATAWGCPVGNCQTVTSATGQCGAAGIPCWCTSDVQCPDGDRCSNWAGCTAGACTGSGTGNAFNCVR